MDKERIDVDFKEWRVLQQVWSEGGAGRSRTVNLVHASEEQKQPSRDVLHWVSEGRIQLGQDFQFTLV